MARRRTDALNLAFARQDHAAMAEIYRLLPRSGQGWPTWLKARVSGLPAALGGPVSKALLAVGSWRARP